VMASDVLIRDARRKLRIERSVLAIPATSAHLFEKAVRSRADCVFLDLEDTVLPESKHAARTQAIAGLNAIEWGRKSVGVRINALDSEWAHREILELIEQSPRLDFILVPKVESAFDVQFVDRLICAIARERQRDKAVGIEAIVETPLGVANVEAIAGSSPRLESIVFGMGDYSVDMHTCDTVMSAASPPTLASSGTERDRPPNDSGEQWDYARARIANACRACDLRPIEGPFTRYSDVPALRASAQRAAARGYEGKWVIHPQQIDTCNEVFSPSSAQVQWANEILMAMDAAVLKSQGVIAMAGKVVDRVHVRLARAIVQRASAIAANADQSLKRNEPALHGEN
jgi:malyl-CoA/(S)-citramalyl-CoA lyase